MSEKKYPTKKIDISLILTVVVAVAAVAALIALLMLKGDNKAQGASSNDSNVSLNAQQQLANECGENAQELIKKNYEVIKLFVTQGLPHVNEPYGNTPETGYFEADSSEYKTFEQLETFVKSVYTAKEAERILTQMPADPSTTGGDLIAVYAVRKSLRDGSAALGISEKFKPNTNYNKNWSSISIKAVPTSEEECNITVYLGDDASSVSDSDIFNSKMVKENGEWRLSEMMY